MKLYTERFGFLCLCDTFSLDDNEERRDRTVGSARARRISKSLEKRYGKTNGRASIIGGKHGITIAPPEVTSLSSERRITLTTSNEIDRTWILHNRTQNFKPWWEEAQLFKGRKFEKFRSNTDVDGPILDFVIAGFSKSGTSSLLANLGQIAPMPLKDVCAKAEYIVKAAYGEWNEQYGWDGENLGNDSHHQEQQKFLKGSKCPRYIGSELQLLQGFSNALPNTKLIVGIRHPVLWFQSFWKMLGNGVEKKTRRLQTPNQRTGMCPCAPNQDGGRTCQVQDYNTTSGETVPGTERHHACHTECEGSMLYCLARTRFHVGLAQLGKTLLSGRERQLLASKDVDGGSNLVDLNIRNPIFLYEQTMLRHNETWQELADFLGISHIPNTHYQAARGKQFKEANICLPEYDYLRSQIMVYSYELSEWLVEYLLPVAEDPMRSDVTIANMGAFTDMVATSYRQDPCNRLVLDTDNNRIQFVLNSALNETMRIPPQPEIVQIPVSKAHLPRTRR
ncbi:MAG: hypothetical protein SGARI_000423 [Bacillariaceae sp.]